MKQIDKLSRMPTAHPTEWENAALDYRRIETILDFLETEAHRQPSLEEIARQAHLSEFHFQKLFTRWVGISPKRFLQFLTKEHAKHMLTESRDVLTTALEAGLSGPGRLHDLFVTCEAMTPGEFKQRGEGLTVRYGFHPTPFGECFVAMTDRGICGLAFVEASDRAQALARYRAQWFAATWIHDQERTTKPVQHIFASRSPKQKIPLLLGGTNFQIKVWEALLRIPEGAVVSYRDIADYLGAPTYSRAIGSAVGANPIAYLIPCHRVIRGMGVFGEYRWGSARKKAILGWEFSKNAAPTP